MADGKQVTGGGGPEPGNELADNARTQLPRDQGNDDDDERCQHRREDAQPARRLAKKSLAQSSEQRRQRALVVVGNGRVPRRDAKIQLVPVVAVAICEGHHHDELRQGNRHDGRPRKWRSRTHAGCHHLTH